MGGMDIIVFTGGIGENDSRTRYEACKKMDFLGISIDQEKNETTVKGKEGIISTEDSRVKVLVIPTNEELVIAQETVQLLQNKKARKGTK